MRQLPKQQHRARYKRYSPLAPHVKKSVVPVGQGSAKMALNLRSALKYLAPGQRCTGHGKSALPDSNSPPLQECFPLRYQIDVRTDPAVVRLEAWARIR